MPRQNNGTAVVHELTSCVGRGRSIECAEAFIWLATNNKTSLSCTRAMARSSDARQQRGGFAGELFKVISKKFVKLKSKSVVITA